MMVDPPVYDSYSGQSSIARKLCMALVGDMIPSIYLYKHHKLL
jgi:hypothetical protein